MDGAVHEALRGVRKDLSDFREDFKQHVEDDREVKAQVDRWAGAVQIMGWVLGIGVPAILTALTAHVIRHW